MKKFFVLLTLTPLLACAAAAQTPKATPTEPHGVTVIGGRWDREVYNPALLDDPLDISTDAAQLLRERREVSRINATRNERGGRAPLPPPAEPSIKTVRRSSGPAFATNIYLYQIRVSNGGTKKIRSIVWDYVLFDRDTLRETGRNRFESKVDIGVGKTKDLFGSSKLPPATVVDVSKSDKVERGQYAEAVEIERVEYSDGTFWERSHEQ